MYIYKKIFFRRLLLIAIVCLIIFNDIIAQACDGTWATNHTFTYDCFVAEQFIGYQNVTDPPGCPINPVYVGTQTNTFTFNNPVNSFSFDFNAFSTAPGCGKMEVKINGVFYPLTSANLVDVPVSSGCTGNLSFLELTPGGYITGSATGGNQVNGQGRLVFNNVNATSITISTNDGGGTLFRGPINCSFVVPIKLVSFTGIQTSDCKAQVRWITGTEFNVRNIELLQSLDGTEFKSVTDVVPKGSNSVYTVSVNNYANAFFKLKIIDLDGHYEYSEIITVKSSCDVLTHQIIPNPAHNFIDITGLQKDDRIFIFDMLGKKVSSFLSPQRGKLDIHKLASGVYYLQVQNAGVIKDNIKFIKNRYFYT